MGRFVEKAFPAFESLSECKPEDKVRNAVWPCQLVRLRCQLTSDSQKKVEKVLKFWLTDRVMPEAFVRKIAVAIGAQIGELELAAAAYGRRPCH